MPHVKELAGCKFSGWQLHEVLGVGTDGVVYAASKDGARRSLKIFLPESLEKNGREAARERLELQLSMIGKTAHPNLVNVYEGGEDAEYNTFFLVMDLVPGTSLDKLLGKVPRDRIPALARQLAAAAEYLEKEHDLHHRDIKPANVIISDDFQNLTLLDLGIVYRFTGDDSGRVSGEEFVGTLRYSPPEFVWRTEESQEKRAWRAISIYQIGATLYDMIMGVPIFDGMDSPRSRLYDCVRYETPRLSSPEIPNWLIYTVQACLLKEWRQRLRFVDWESFSGPRSTNERGDRESEIRVRQLRMAEMRKAEKLQGPPEPSKDREEGLWRLNSALFMEIRTFIVESPIFPRPTVSERAISEKHYVSEFSFRKDPELEFHQSLNICIEVESTELDGVTRLTFTATVDGNNLLRAAWEEIFSVEAAFERCRESLLDSIDLIVPKE